MNRNSKGAGFTLIELMIYMAILGIVSGLFIGILGTSTRLQLHEVASNEVSNQMNFVLQTIQRLVRESSVAIVSDSTTCTNASDSANDGGALIGAPQPCLKLRMKDSVGNLTDRDPIYIWKDTTSGAIKLAQGSGGNQTINDLTTNKAWNASNALAFTKFSNTPAHDIIQVDLTLNYNTPNPQSAFSKTLSTAIGRVSAATFDSNLIPAGTVGSRNIGQVTQQWENLYLSGNLNVAGNGVVTAATGPSGDFTVGPTGYLRFDKSAAGAPSVTDCDQDTERGRFYIDTANNLLYICNGQTRGWDYITLTN